MGSISLGTIYDLSSIWIEFGYIAVVRTRLIKLVPDYTAFIAYNSTPVETVQVKPTFTYTYLRLISLGTIYD